MRDKLIELIDDSKACPYDYPCAACGYDEYPSCFAARMADFLIANGVVVQEWIPVSERLPEEDGIYLISVNTETKGIYSRTAWYFTQNEQWLAMQEVTHWMPLPEPPKECE